MVCRTLQNLKLTLEEARRSSCKHLQYTRTVVTAPPKMSKWVLKLLNEEQQAVAVTPNIFPEIRNTTITQSRGYGNMCAS